MQDDVTTQPLNHHLQDFYYTLTKTYTRATLITLFFAVLLVLVYQVTYSDDRTLPFTKIDDIPIGQMSQIDAINTVQSAYSGLTVEISSDYENGDIYTSSLIDLGFEIDGAQKVHEVTQYPIYQRLIPFTFLKYLFADQGAPNIIKNDSLENKFATSQRVDARVAVTDQLVVVPSSNRYVYDEDNFTKTVMNIVPSSAVQKCQISLDWVAERPIITTEIAQSLYDKVQPKTKDGVKLANNQSEITIDYEKFLPLLHFTNDYANARIDLSVDPTLLEDFVTGANVDYEKLATSLEDYLVSDDQVGKITEVPYKKQVILEQASSRETWDALRADLESKYKDSPFAILVIDLSSSADGNSRDLAINADQTFTAASTYKLYTALSMFRSLQAGGQLPDCFDNMIVYSQNECPEDFLAHYSMSKSQADAHSIGAISTFFGNHDMRTTPRDLGTYLTKLYQNQLLEPEQTTHLLDDMKKQVFRQGIPAGVGKSGVVADKVGFLEGLLHDAAIVYSDRGNYIEVIMTDGCSWGDIAEVARRVQDAF